MEELYNKGLLADFYSGVVDKVYFTMSDHDLISVGQHRNVPGILEMFTNNVAFFAAPQRFIVLHIPAIIEAINEMQFRSDDPKGKVLFTIYFFDCLFHELMHALQFAWTSKNGTFQQWENIHNCSRLEEQATIYAFKQVKRLGTILNEKNSCIGELANQLFNWRMLLLLVGKNMNSKKKYLWELLCRIWQSVY